MTLGYQPIAVPESTIASQDISHPFVGIRIISPGTRSSDDIRSHSSFSSPSSFIIILFTVTTSEDWIVERRFFWFCNTKINTQYKARTTCTHENISTYSSFAYHYLSSLVNCRNNTTNGHHNDSDCIVVVFIR